MCRLFLVVALCGHPTTVKINTCRLANHLEARIHMLRVAMLRGYASTEYCEGCRKDWHGNLSGDLDATHVPEYFTFGSSIQPRNAPLLWGYDATAARRQAFTSVYPLPAAFVGHFWLEVEERWGMNYIKMPKEKNTPSPWWHPEGDPWCIPYLDRPSPHHHIDFNIPAPWDVNAMICQGRISNAGFSWIDEAAVSLHLGKISARPRGNARQQAYRQLGHAVRRRGSAESPHLPPRMLSTVQYYRQLPLVVDGGPEHGTVGNMIGVCGHRDVYAVDHSTAPGSILAREFDEFRFTQATGRYNEYLWRGPLADGAGGIYNACERMKRIAQMIEATHKSYVPSGAVTPL